MDDNKQFNDAYWLHQPKEVRVLRDIPDVEKSAQVVQDLALKYLIDLPIMVWGWDPYKVMLMRESYGYTWVNSAGQPPPRVAPRTDFPNDIGIKPYDPNNPPPGSIKVSTKISDYPPVDPPSAPAKPKPSSHIGPDMGGGFFTQIDPDTDTSKEGDLVTGLDGAMYKFRKYPFGGWYIKQV